MLIQGQRQGLVDGAPEHAQRFLIARVFAGDAQRPVKQRGDEREQLVHPRGDHQALRRAVRAAVLVQKACQRFPQAALALGVPAVHQFRFVEQGFPDQARPDFVGKEAHIGRLGREVIQRRALPLRGQAALPLRHVRQRADVLHKVAALCHRAQKALRPEKFQRAERGLFRDAQVPAQRAARGQPGAASQPPLQDVPGNLPVQLLIQRQGAVRLQAVGQLVHRALWYGQIP